MLKILIHDLDLVRIEKLKSLVSGISIFSEIVISRDEDGLLKLVKNQSFDVFVLNIPHEKFKNKLIGVFPDLKLLPVIFLNSNFSLDEFSKASMIELLDTNVKLVPFLNALATVLPQETLKSSDELIQDYIPIEIVALKKIKATPCDLYHKLGKEKFLKIVNHDEELHDFFLDRYLNKGLKNFFVKKTDFYKYSDLLFVSVLPDESKFSSKLEHFNASQSVIHEMILDMGINENVVKIVDDLIVSSLDDYKDQKLKEMFNKFKFSPDRYIYDHSTLTSMFAVSLCERFEWRNQAILQKLVFASMFHDFAFKDYKLALLESDYDQVKTLSKEQRQEVLSHPEKIRDLLAQNKEISSDVLNLVYRHHEGQMEDSYPNGISSLKLSLIECVFIVSHEISSQLYRHAFRADKLQTIYFRMLKYMEHGNLKQIKPAFETVFIKCKDMSV